MEQKMPEYEANTQYVTEEREAVRIHKEGVDIEITPEMFDLVESEGDLTIKNWVSPYALEGVFGSGPNEETGILFQMIHDPEFLGGPRRLFTYPDQDYLDDEINALTELLENCETDEQREALSHVIRELKEE